MRAIVLNKFGGVENFQYQEVEIPQPAAGEVLVKIAALSVNPVDAKTRAGYGMAGRLKDQFPLVLGWDISGTVIKVGEGATRFKVGDEVFGMVNFPKHARAYAEYVAAPVAELALKPTNINHHQAAAATLAALTAYQSIQHTLGSIQPGQRVLVHAASGGVGHFAVQIAKHLGAYVIGTSSAANKDFVLGLGADEHIDYKAHRFEDVVSNVDIVLDNVGGDTIDRSLTVLKEDGHIISYPGGGGTVTRDKAADAGKTGYVFMVWPDGNDMEAIANLLKQGIIKPHVSKTFDFNDMRAAHLQIESGRTVGKIVVTL
ncbi:NADP-dependent oxidoreductase [Flavobacterium zepuense]|uniref:NADP-dependent oxidoreductase n=1 Tax=Flavobacterium zepuense TaxID=2593302 RepID=A0A552UV40_9FLAO|nr:NADP-dependent oxidoreductase [Flavobacterium zepuense]TRW22030.1 NADP-dependent oxidoreductase [Flavobacterium zepuense]